jgi:hypothetical protein
LHRLPEDAKGNSRFAKVGGKRQAVRTSTNDRGMYKIRGAVHVRGGSLLLFQEIRSPVVVLATY